MTMQNSEIFLRFEFKPQTDFSSHFFSNLKYTSIHPIYENDQIEISTRKSPSRQKNYVNILRMNNGLFNFGVFSSDV